MNRMKASHSERSGPGVRITINSRQVRLGNGGRIRDVNFWISIMAGDSLRRALRDLCKNSVKNRISPSGNVRGSRGNRNVRYHALTVRMRFR